MNFFELNKFAARFQIAATVAKLLACALIIVTGFYYLWVKGKLQRPLVKRCIRTCILVNFRETVLGQCAQLKPIQWCLACKKLYDLT